MLTVGDSAPTFDCTAVVGGEVVELKWGQLHEDKILVLLFDSVEIDVSVPGNLAALASAHRRIARLQSKLAIVCRDHVFEIQTWADRLTDGGAAGDALFPFIVDADHCISSMYDMVSAEGQTIWGRVIVDSVGRLRQVVMHAIPVGTNIDELLRCITSINDEER